MLTFLVDLERLYLPLIFIQKIKFAVWIQPLRSEHSKRLVSTVNCHNWCAKRPQEKLKTMIMQNLGVTNKKHYGMLWFFLEWSSAFFAQNI